MSDIELKSIFKKYKRRVNAILSLFIFFFIGANWFLINHGIERRYELGLPQQSIDTGFTWGAILLGLMVVLNLCIYFIENVLVDIFKQQDAE